jgi:hypothetical protein
MFALVTASTAPEATVSGPGPVFVTLALGTAVLVLLASAGLLGAALRMISTMAKVLAGLEKVVVTGISKVVALVVTAALLVIAVQLMQSPPT